LNERLKLFLEYNKILCEEQAGFRNGYSTSDNIFTLNFIIGLYLNKGKILYGAFVDYRKAFDSIHRITLWKKLVSYNIDGYFLKVIHNMYSMAKSCVKNGSVISRFFDCNSGVRQGGNLSPLLFALFLNDLNTYLSTHYAGLTSWCKDMNEKLPDDELDIFRKLCILLYADDTIILAESPHQLQKALDGMAEYCRKNKLKVNETKTKIVVFSRGKIRNIPTFYLMMKN
jgi:sorting nexin-29